MRYSFSKKSMNSPTASIGCCNSWLSPEFLGRARGVVLGAFVDCNPAKGKSSLTLRQVFLDTFAGFKYPVLEGIRYGHVKNSLTMPLGVRVRLNAGRGAVSFLESAVS